MPAIPILPSPAVIAARQRRSQRLGWKIIRQEWFIDQVFHKVRLTVRERVELAVEWLRNKVVENISVPVGKSFGSQGRDDLGRFTRRSVFVSERSKPGEYPRADTTQLMKTIFKEVNEVKTGAYEGSVGTPLDYGIILEISPRFDRSYLVRTFLEQIEPILKIMGGPIKL